MDGLKKEESDGEEERDVGKNNNEWLKDVAERRAQSLRAEGENAGEGDAGMRIVYKVKAKEEDLEAVRALKKTLLAKNAWAGTDGARHSLCVL